MATSITADDLLSELAALYQTEGAELQPGEITADLLAKEIGRGRETARLFLERQVAAGKLRRVDKVIKGHLRTVYVKA